MKELSCNSMGFNFGEEFLVRGILGGTKAGAEQAPQNLAACCYACAAMIFPFSA